MIYPTDLVAALKAFGFEDKAAKIYLAGVELGPATVLELARRTQLKRTTLYPILEELRRSGFFRLGKTRRGSVYTAESPAALGKQLEARARQFHGALPRFEALAGTIREGAGVTLYEGSEGFRQLWQKVFRSGVKEYRILTSGVGLLEFVREPYLVERIIAERIRRGIRSIQLIADTSDARRIVTSDREQLRESRFLPKGIALPATVIIFGNEVAFITTRRENTMVLIASGETAVSLRTAFDLLWASAEAPA